MYGLMSTLRSKYRARREKYKERGKEDGVGETYAYLQEWSS